MASITGVNAASRCASSGSKAPLSRPRISEYTRAVRGLTGTMKPISSIRLPWCDETQGWMSWEMEKPEAKKLSGASSRMRHSPPGWLLVQAT
ncbi:hypothetical protein D3C77_710390 [compost metagenome]